MRGVLTALLNRRTYNMFFDWMYPDHINLLELGMETCCDSVDLSIALLKLLAELVHNRSDRIMFDSSSPNGILLFKHASKIMVTYGQKMTQYPVQSDVYVEKFFVSCSAAFFLHSSLSCVVARSKGIEASAHV